MRRSASLFLAANPDSEPLIVKQADSPRILKEPFPNDQVRPGSDEAEIPIRDLCAMPLRLANPRDHVRQERQVQLLQPPRPDGCTVSNR